MKNELAYWRQTKIKLENVIRTKLLEQTVASYTKILKKKTISEDFRLTRKCKERLKKAIM